MHIASVASKPRPVGFPLQIRLPPDQAGKRVGLHIVVDKPVLRVGRHIAAVAHTPGLVVLVQPLQQALAYSSLYIGVQVRLRQEVAPRWVQREWQMALVVYR